MVEVYSKTLCPQCRMVKKFLENKGIPYREVNIENDPDVRTELQALGFQTVPVTFVPDSGEYITGFNVPKLRQI